MARTRFRKFDLTTALWPGIMGAHEVQRGGEYEHASSKALV